MFKPKNKVGYPLLVLVAFMFVVLLLLNVITIFSNEAVNLGPSTAVACVANGHSVWFASSPSGGHWICLCGPPYTCCNCQPGDYAPSHWERINLKWVCVCGGPSGSFCPNCVSRNDL